MKQPLLLLALLASSLCLGLRSGAAEAKRPSVQLIVADDMNCAPLLADPQRPWKMAAFAVTLRGNKTDLGRSIRTERFTFIEWPDRSTQLYDHTTDPKEYVTLATDPRHAQTAAEMKQWLNDGWQAARPPTP